MEGEARMRQETLGLSRFPQLVRRAWTAVGEVAAVSLVAGIVFAAVHPPMLTSTAVVVLAQLPQSAQAAASNGAPDAYTATQEVIAGSGPVLWAALPDVRPAMSLAELRGDVQIRSLTRNIIAVSARGRIAADAEATANAVARSYIVYVSSAGSPAGHVEAQMLQSATSATGRSLLVSLLITGGFSALYGAIVGVICALAFGWAGRRFRVSR
jgi:capsular polysaccharide biosynthesis protein